MRVRLAIAIPSALCLLGAAILWSGGLFRSQEVAYPVADDAPAPGGGVPAEAPSLGGPETGRSDSTHPGFSSPAGTPDVHGAGAEGAPNGASPAGRGGLHHGTVRVAGVDLDGDAALWKSGVRTGLLEGWRQVAKDHPAEPNGLHARDLILATTLEDGETAALTDDMAEWVQYLCETSKARAGKRRYAGCFWTEAGDKDPMGRMFEALGATGRRARPPIESAGTGRASAWVYDTLKMRLDGAELDDSRQLLRGAVLEFLGIATSYLRSEGGGKSPAAQMKERASLVDAFLAKYTSASDKPVVAMVHWLRAWYPR